MARTTARHLAGRRLSTALTAFGSFSALVAVSVALSNGSATSPWESARADGPQGQTGDQASQSASLFAAVPDQALITKVREAPAENVAGHVRTMSDRGDNTAASSMAPTKRAPAVFKGELPVNTIIAPAQPTTVLDGGRFGWRTAPDTGQRDFHDGADISVPKGTPVVAALDGTVTATFWDVWGGNRVEVSHADGMKTTYNHLDTVMVQVGDSLKASEQLGTVGQTGLRVTGPHLHFETWVQGKAVDPQSFDWETGEGVIPASRPKYSMEDQAQIQDTTPENGSAPGTDNGPVSEVPAHAEHIMAADQQPARSHDAAAPSSSGHSEAARDVATRENTGKTSAAARDAQHEQSAATDAVGKAPAGGGQADSEAAADRAAKTAADKAAADRAAKQKAAADRAAADKTAADEAAKSAADKAAADRAAKQKAAAEKAAADKAAADKAAADKAAKDAQSKPAPVATKDPVAPKPQPAKPNPPVVDPYTAPITQLTTLQQIQQRTKALLDEQMALTPAQQFGPGSQLKAQLPLLTQQLITAKVDAQNPAFTAQLTAAQVAVDKAAAAPADKKLTDAATAELVELQKLLADVPGK